MRGVFRCRTKSDTTATSSFPNLALFPPALYTPSPAPTVAAPADEANLSSRNKTPLPVVVLAWLAHGLLREGAPGFLIGARGGSPDRDRGGDGDWVEIEDAGDSERSGVFCSHQLEGTFEPSVLCETRPRVVELRPCRSC